jgi:hypothetical protein
MINPAQPPEGILDPQQPWWPTKNIGERLWMQFKAKLTGNKMPDGMQYSSFVKVSEADADRIVENIKKYGQYPQVNQSGKDGGYSNLETYQKWVVEEFLEKPFREQVNEKIDQAMVKKKVKEIVEIDKETEDVAPAVEEPAQLVSVVEDKIDALEAIREEIAPPRSKFQPPPDPWGDPTVPPKVKAQAKKTKKKASKRKKRKEAPPPSEPKQTFATKMGGSVRKTTAGGGIGNSILSFMERGSSNEGEGPSLMQIGAAFGRKVQKAFDEAKEQRERALEAEANGAELPPEVKEKGYFIKKSLGYQFGGEVYDKTLGAFLEDMPSRQSKAKAGFKDQFDYGDADPNKQKRQDSIKDLATGFRKVSSDLKKVNSSINQNISIQTSLLGESTRIADTLEQIQSAIAGLVGIEIESDADAAASGGDINIGDINLGGKKKGFDLFGALFDGIDAVDDVVDIMRHLRGKKKGLGKQNPLYKKMRRRGGPSFKGGMPKGKFGMLRTALGAGRAMLSEGGRVGLAGGGGIPAMIGEAGPEVLMRGGSSLAGGLADNKGLLKLVNPFAKVMQLPLQTMGAIVSNTLSTIVGAAGPFSGLIAKMFLPMVGGLATIFGLNQGAFAAEMNSAAMTEKQGAKALAGFFANFFSIFGIKGKDKSIDTDPSTGPGYVPIDWKQDPAFGAAVNKVAQYFDISAADLMGLMASESGLRPDADNGSHVGLIQFSATSAQAAGTTQADLKKMSRAEQMPYVQEYLKNAKLPKGASAGQLYTAVFLPAFVGKPDDFVVASKDGSEPAGYSAESPRWYSGNSGLDADNDGKITIRELGGRIEKKKKEFNIQAAKGTTSAATFLNNTQGVFRIEGPDSGYHVPQELTGDKKVIGHGEEMLFKFTNKFVILPISNKEYDARSNPDDAFNRYREIGRQGGVDVAGLVDAMDRLLFGKPKTGKMPVYGEGFKPRRTYSAADESGAEILRTLGGIPVKGASLPEGTATPVAIPKDTVTGTTGQAVAVVQPVVQYVPVPGPERVVVEEVPANPFVAARKSSEMLYLQTLS